MLAVLNSMVIPCVETGCAPPGPGASLISPDGCLLAEPLEKKSQFIPQPQKSIESASIAHPDNSAFMYIVVKLRDS